MKRVRQAWQIVGFAGDTTFLIASLGGIATLGAIGAGLLVALTAIPVTFLIVASIGLLALLVVIVPLALSRLWPLIAGPRISIGEWSMDVRLEKDQMIAQAGVSVWNGRDAGGDRACARGVVPQVEVFTPDGQRLYHHVGWEASNQRDFPATREEERLKLAEQTRGEDYYFIGHRSPFRHCKESYVEGRLTLRGANLSRPVTSWFSLGLDESGNLWVSGE
jgi:hypothetical protein